MAIPFWPKIAGVEDAPNYRPTAGDSRCETCSYFRALNDGVGYCERFSFEAEPQSVCDEFVGAGRTKVSSASIGSRLIEVYRSPITKRVGISSVAGAGAGALAGGAGSGEDKYREGLKGALVGGALGGAIGGIGPLARSYKLRKAFNESQQAAGESLKAEKKLLSDNQNIEKQREKLLEDVRNATGGTYADYMDKRRAYMEFINKHPKSGTSADIRKNNAQISKFEEKLKEKYTPDEKEIARAAGMETFGAPALSALIAGGAGFGLSHGSKEHYRFQKSRRDGE